MSCTWSLMRRSHFRIDYLCRTCDNWNSQVKAICVNNHPFNEKTQILPAGWNACLLNGYWITPIVHHRWNICLSYTKFWSWRLLSWLKHVGYTVRWYQLEDEWNTVHTFQSLAVFLSNFKLVPENFVSYTYVTGSRFVHKVSSNVTAVIAP